MALRYTVESPRSAQAGSILLVVHPFTARSPDELSLAKGDRIELIERDDDFGDGWYLGKHLQNGNTGLFPEVYTTSAPKPTLTNAQMQKTNNPFGEYGNAPVKDATPTSFARYHSNPSGFNNVVHPRRNSPSSSSNSLPSVIVDQSQTIQSQTSRSPPLGSTRPTHSVRETSSSSLNRVVGQASAVMNETLSVINEHITDMRSPGLQPLSPGLQPVFKDRTPSHDSGSEYSSHVEHRLSYINGTETDEEEQNGLTDEEVRKWSPARVAEYLEDSGVEKGHCDIFQQQEFSGEVLLGMEQSSIFLKELELGSVGRRLKTWQRIKALQDEVKIGYRLRKAGGSEASRPSTASPNKSRSSSTPDPNLRRINPAIEDTGSSGEDGRPNCSKLQAHIDHSRTSSLLGSISTSALQQGARPSAASIRSLGHSRRHSSIDQQMYSGTTTPPVGVSASHGKQSSFDKGWTMNGVATRVGSLGRQRASTHTQSISSDHSLFESARNSQISLSTTTDQDRGYASGMEGDAKSRQRVSKKKDSANPFRQPSWGSDSRRSSFFRRSSRQASPTRSNDFNPNKAELNRHVSAPVHEHPSPTVTTLEYGPDHSRHTLPGKSRNSATDSSPQISNSSSSLLKSVRAVSDAVTGRERAFVSSPMDHRSPLEKDLTRSPTDASSSNRSGASKDNDQEDASQPQFSSTSQSVSSTGTKRKTKKDTSAYTRGLEKKSPKEQVIGCEHSGWMKKKSSNIMASWKPRLFVLRGRRLSYYYSENDTEEKGLIDISNHRVLPADNDPILGLHASIFGLGSAPTSPPMTSSTFSPVMSDSSVISSAGTSPATYNPSPVSSISMNGTQDNQLFIFKLVPPRSGLSKAVNFTKPTVHYFAVNSLSAGRLWMAALMKATIDRDESLGIKTSYVHKTISLEKARARRERPPALRGVDEEAGDDGEEEQSVGGAVEGAVNGVIPDSGLRDGAGAATAPIERTDKLQDDHLARLGVNLDNLMPNGNGFSYGEDNRDSKRRISLHSNTMSTSSARGLGIDGLEADGPQ